MKIKNACRIRFITKGVQTSKNIKYCEDIFGIPLCYSPDIHRLNVVQFEDKSVLIISNEEYRKSIGETLFKIDITSKLLKVIFDTNDELLGLMHISKWFGCSNTINYVKMHTGNVETRKNTIRYIEQLSKQIDKYSIGSIDNILNDIKPVEII